ncbi:unnamed protein product [Durusdinium trenchii]|uniref:Leucine-rich repeat and WD repeat-containing protein 1 n=1 Tax=Durusdinium trenchii TaxID=1381693 RepID=A0ABP0NBL7_9DINO
METEQVVTVDYGPDWSEDWALGDGIWFGMRWIGTTMRDEWHRSWMGTSLVTVEKPIGEEPEPKNASRHEDWQVCPAEVVDWPLDFEDVQPWKGPERVERCWTARDWNPDYAIEEHYGWDFNLTDDEALEVMNGGFTLKMPLVLMTVVNYGQVFIKDIDMTEVMENIEYKKAYRSYRGMVLRHMMDGVPGGEWQVEPRNTWPIPLRPPEGEVPDQIMSVRLRDGENQEEDNPAANEVAAAEEGEDEGEEYDSDSDAPRNGFLRDHHPTTMDWNPELGRMWEYRILSGPESAESGEEFFVEDENGVLRRQYRPTASERSDEDLDYQEMEVDGAGEVSQAREGEVDKANPPRDAGWWDMETLLKYQKEGQEESARKVLSHGLFPEALFKEFLRTRLAAEHASRFPHMAFDHILQWSREERTDFAHFAVMICTTQWEEDWEGHVVGLDGEGFAVQAPSSFTGRQLRRMIRDQLPCKAGARVSLKCGSNALDDLSLEEAFARAATRCVTYVYVPVNLQDTWRCLQQAELCEDDAELSFLEGITQLNGIHSMRQLERGDLRSLRVLSFSALFDQTLEGVLLPRDLQSLTFGQQFNKSLEGVKLPSLLQNLSFGEFFNQSLEKVNLPPKLKSLRFGTWFNQSLEKVTLPVNLEQLVFGNSFNQRLEGLAWPGSLESLTFGAEFNQSLEHATLPNSLRTLSMGHSFSHSLDRVNLPCSLISLTLGYRFQFYQSLERVAWPRHLQSLTFGQASWALNQRNMLPPSNIVSLTIAVGPEGGSEAQQEPEEEPARPGSLTWRARLTSLTLGHCFNKSLERLTFSETLQKLIFGHDWDQGLVCVTLPESLKSLTFGSLFNQDLQGVPLPSGLEELNFGDSFNRSLEGVSWPQGLRRLKFSHFFNQRITDVAWPSSLQSLTFGVAFNQNLEEVLFPCSLQNLSLGERFDQSLEQVNLPKSIQTLSFGSSFNQPLTAVTLPNNLQSFSLGRNFDQRLHGVVWPDGLQSITLGDGFRQNLEEAAFPSSLQSLTLARATLEALSSNWPFSLRRLECSGSAAGEKLAWPLGLGLVCPVENGVNTAYFSPDGTFVLSAAADKTAKLWCSHTGGVRCPRARVTAEVSGRFSAVSPVELFRWILTASADWTAKLWSRSNGSCVQTYQGHSQWVNMANFVSSSEEKIVTCSRDPRLKDCTARLWAIGGECLRVFEGHSDFVMVSLILGRAESARAASVRGRSVTVFTFFKW